MKKLICLLSVVALLVAVALPVAADAADGAYATLPQRSITEDTTTGLGLAFRFTLNNADVSVKGTCDFSKGTVVYDGQSRPLVKMGAVVTNWASTGTNPDAMVLENVNGEKVIDVPALKLQQWGNGTCAFAVRVIRLPEEYKKTTVYARPYYVVEVDGVQHTVYGDTVNGSYFSVWCANQPEVVLPAIGTDIDVTNQRGRVKVSEAVIVDRTVSLTFRNYTSNWITEETDYVKYTCYDADGKVLVTESIYIGCIDTKKNKAKTYTFDVPDATAEVRLTGSKIVYWTEWA